MMTNVNYSTTSSMCWCKQTDNPRLQKRWWHVHFPRMHCQCQLKIEHLMMGNFCRIDKSTSCLTSIFQKTSICFPKNFGPQCITGKMYSCHLFWGNGGGEIFIHLCLQLQKQPISIEIDLAELEFVSFTCMPPSA